LKNSGDADSNAIRYRADIDGLRAIAVLSVVLYHLAGTTLRGGYLGVDMFFVVSGFLITSILWREAQNGQFSIVRFYDRRIRRIMPALLALLFITTTVATLLMLPADLLGYSKSLVSSLAFVGNIYFWRDTNYFSRLADEKPLLHLWSLGVEEQFYILVPLLIVLLAGRWRRGALPVFVGITLLSLGANIVALSLDGASPAFFLLPTRAWELGFGAVLALLPAQVGLSAATSGKVALLGSLLIVVSLLYPLDQFALLPVALPLVAGTALVILAGRSAAPIVNRALTLPPLVFIGLISYSLYLCHWPIIVFAKYYLVRELSAVESLAALGLMFACATVSWGLIERPFRNKAIPISTVRYGAAVSGAALASTAALLIWSQGLPGRLSGEAAAINAAVGTNYRCPVRDYLIVGLSRGCVMNLPSRDPADADVVLLGNSHALMFAPVWASILAGRGLTGLLLNVNACLPTVQANVSRECIDTARRNLDEVMKLPRARLIVLGLSWDFATDGLVGPEGRVLDNRDDRALVAALDDLITQIVRAGKKVVLIGPIAEPGWDVASTISRQLAFGHPVVRATFTPASDFKRRFGTVISHFEGRGDVGLARADQVQCHNQRCDYILEGRSLFSDDNHIAVAELPRFRPFFEAALPASTMR
jgi:peptidoglycan/LPS O-acetylase OafA/YrhL